MEGEDYWNKSENKAFSFDEDDRTILQIPTERKLFVDDNTSELNYDFPSSDIPLHLIISDSDLNKVLQEQSMDEQKLPKGIILEEELRILRRRIQERIHAPPASVTVTKMIMKKPYSLECYRSFQEKTELLTEAVYSGSGDAVLAVVLFLVKTLQRKYVMKLLDVHPMALNQLVNYLVVRLQVKECVEWMSLLGKSNRLAMLQFEVTTTLLKSNYNKTSKLQSTYNDYFNQPGVNTFYGQIVANYMHLLDFQQKEKQSNAKAFEILDRPVLETLYYASSQYKWNAATNDAVANSPHKLMEMFKISQPQFEWIILNERSRSQAWCDLEGIFEKKAWHNLKSKSFSINVPLDSVIHQLHGLHAPVAVLNYFLSKINDPTARLAVANRVNATKSIVDALNELKDKAGLEKFIETLPVGTDGRFYAENILKNVKSVHEIAILLTIVETTMPVECEKQYRPSEIFTQSFATQSCKMQITTNNSQFFEGCGREGPIRCIFLSEFHPSLGPKITCQVPEGYVSKDIFDSVNVYIIPKPQLQRCILTVNTLGYKIVGYPVRIDSQRYARNAYYFNLCFVCDAWARTIQYEPVIKKLAEYLIMMEDETGFLSRDDEKEELKLERITKLLTNILSDLNEKKVTTIIEGETTIYLKILNHKPDPQPVLDHLVPLLCETYENTPIDVWDLTTQQVLPYINGINHIARIAAESDVEKALVKACIQNLVFHEVVQLLPLLKYSNVYMCTTNLQNLTKDRAMGQSCRKFVAITTDTLPSLYKILQIYSFMTHAVNLRTLCQRTCPRDNNIDERKLVTFGLQNNLIRCVNKYPICTDTPVGRQNMYTGLDSMDEICCMTGLQPSKIDEDIESDPFLTVIWK